MSRSRASRERELHRALRRGAGRPPGSRKSLFDNPKRFTIAANLAVSGLKAPLGPYERAALVAVIVGEETSITIESLRDSFVVLSAHYHQPAMTSFDTIIDRLVRDSRPAAIKRYKGEEANWLAQSSGAIQGVLVFMFVGDELGVRGSLDLLDRAGWREKIANIRGRLAVALRGNLGPFEESGLARTGRKLLDLLDAMAPKTPD
jgi:hypothetical protein